MPSLILIGPTKSGKTTVAKLLCAQTGLPRRSAHDIQFEKYAAQGYDQKKASDIWTEQGDQGYERYMQPFYALAVRSLLNQPGEAIIDLESEYVAFEDAALLAQLKADFQPFPQVVLLLPSADLEESVKILRQREMADMDSVSGMNDFFVDHPSNQLLAKHTFYTDGKTPEETSEEIIASLDLSKPQPIILIGPMGAGKSTLGLLLSRKLEREQISLDMVRWDYYKEIGYDNDRAGEIHSKEGFQGLYYYWQPFHAHAVERIVADYPDRLIDFGAGHSVYADPALLERVKNTLAPYNNIILILPSPDPAESKQILKQRGLDLLNSYFDLHESFTRSGAFEELAKQTIYTEGKTPEQVAAEILGQSTIH
jgi:energy-coupling factor transporter ATP-binding protein EcfA2